jgi:predicted RNA-binding protein YlqC (UPF0109 family)
MTDEKTVVELSVELNIDLQKLKNKINYAVRTGKLEVVKKSGKNYYEKKAVETLLNKVENADEFNNEIQLLRKQHDEDKRQIENLTKLLDQQQQLTLMAQQNQENLKIELAEERSKTWWQKLRGK